MNRLLNIFITLICATQLCVAQITDNSEYEEKIAKELILQSGFRQLLSYSPNVKYFLKAGYGNLEYGPNGVITYIHEALHVYDNIKSAGMGNSLYYWHDSTTMLKTRLLQGYITTDSIFTTLPNFVKDKSITKTYITCTNNCFSRTYGIYGLLEEFNAIAQHTVFMMQSYNFFDTCAYTNKPKFWEGYLKCKYDSWMNFYYFNIFFSTYLKYIEGNQKDIYNQLISDTSFKSTFTKIYNKYSNALTCLNCIENKVLSKISKKKPQKYIYPFMEEYNTVKALSESEVTQKYVFLLLNK
jgi:hypothetical protein